MNSTLRRYVPWMVLVVVVVLIWNVSMFQTADNAMPFSEFLRQVDAGEVERVELAGNEISGTLTGGTRFKSYAPPQYEGLANRLVERDFAIAVLPSSSVVTLRPACA